MMDGPMVRRSVGPSVIFVKKKVAFRVSKGN